MNEPLVAGAAGKKPLSTAVQELYEQKVKILTEDEEPEIETDFEVKDRTPEEIKKKKSTLRDKQVPGCGPSLTDLPEKYERKGRKTAESGLSFLFFRWQSGVYEPVGSGGSYAQKGK